MEKSELAFEDWKQGMKYKEIADKYGISLGTVKSWASRKWKQLDKEKVATNKEKRLQVGAPKGNKNAMANKGGAAPEGNQNAVGNKGGRAPEGNKNNLKHGIYEKLLYSALSEEEKALFELDEINVIEELKKTIRLCDIQIMRFMRKMKEAEEKQGGLIADSVTVTNNKCYDKNLDKMQLNNSTMVTTTSAAHNLVIRYNAEIDRIKRQKIKCLEELNAIEGDTNSLNNNTEITIKIGEEDF